MPTLKEYFFADHHTLTFHREIRLTAGDDEVTAIARAHLDFIAGARYASYFIPATANPVAACEPFIADAEVAVRVADESVSVEQGETTLPSQKRLRGTDLVWTNRVYVYVDADLADEAITQLGEQAKQRGVSLLVRDARYARDRSALETPRAFISHDSRDKDEIARDLAVGLRDLLCPVWYDEFSLEVGDSLRESIDRGLSVCPRCIVVLSPNFFANDGWTKAEFNAIWSKHVSEGDVLLPVWHNVTREEVATYSPLVVDTVALNSNIGIEELTRRLFNKLMSDPLRRSG